MIGIEITSTTKTVTQRFGISPGSKKVYRGKDQQISKKSRTVKSYKDLEHLDHQDHKEIQEETQNVEIEIQE